MKIIIIQHENDFEGAQKNYFIEIVADYWLRSGHEVVFINGLHSNVSADVALLHVNLSVVPEEYIQYSRQFPIVLNQKVTDIRKRAISQNLLERNTGYGGPVLVKTDLNCAGLPEYRLLQWSLPHWKSFRGHCNSLYRNGRKLLIKLRMLENLPDSSMKKSRYRESFRILNNRECVPSHIWSDTDWVIEKYLPETEESLFVIRNAYFLGHKMIGFKHLDSDPVVKEGEQKGEVIEINRAVIHYRSQIGLDYGKIDYVEYNGEPVILDVTKTMGGAFGRETAEILAPGLNDYLSMELKVS